MGEIGGGGRFAAEPLDEGLAVGELPVEHLDRDLAAQAAVLSHVDVGHSAAGEMGYQGVSSREDA